MHRFWSKVDLNGPDGYHSQTGENLGPCWLWTASKNTSGYGQFSLGGRSVVAHRLAYEWEVGPIPEGMDLDHLCRVRHCVRHTEPATRSENILRGQAMAVNAARNAAKAYCPQGHEYAGSNLYLVPKNGKRQCRTCRREADRRRQPRERQSLVSVL